MTATTTIKEMVYTGLYDKKAIEKYHAKQVKANNGSVAMVIIYKHNFIIIK